MKVITNAAGLIVMMTESGNPTPPEGGAIHELNEEELAAFNALPPNGGVSFVPGEEGENGEFTTLPLPPSPSFPNPSSEGLTERRARRAERRGDDLTAIKLRMGITR